MDKVNSVLEGGVLLILVPRPRGMAAGKRPRRRVLRSLRVRPPLHHNSHYPNSVPPFRRNAAPSAYRLSSQGSWYYGDLVGHGRVTNPLTGIRADHPHLVLSDWKKPRFVLGFHSSSSGFTITSIQRVRTEYRLVRSKGIEKLEWLRDKEIASQRKLAQSLGMHPAEFLLNEFIFAHRKAILSGEKVRLRIMVGSREKSLDTIYRPLIDRFFKKDSVESGLPGMGIAFHTFDLSLDKRRVREALGLPPLKK